MNNLKKFYNDCFKDLIKELNITDYQARASKTGDMFEYAFWYIIQHKYNFIMIHNVDLPKACMTGTGKLDFGVFKKDKFATPENMICGIEAKGSDPDSSERPGLIRTDTMKKAISQAYQFKRTYPKIPFFVVSNVVPTSGNGKCMMDLAEGDIIDKFVDVTDKKALEDFVKRLQSYQ